MVWYVSYTDEDKFWVRWPLLTLIIIRVKGTATPELRILNGYLVLLELLHCSAETRENTYADPISCWFSWVGFFNVAFGLDYYQESACYILVSDALGNPAIDWYRMLNGEHTFSEKHNCTSSGAHSQNIPESKTAATVEG